MKHCIIVRFTPQTDMDSLLPGIQALFDETKSIPGVRDVRLIPGVNRRGSRYANRYDLMIEMTTDAAGLAAYDRSDPHAEWKKRYGAMIEAKCIFDYE